MHCDSMQAHRRARTHGRTHAQVLIYQNAELGPLTQDATATINAHPEWWCRDDDGTPLKTTQGYFLNHTLADVRAWYNHCVYPLPPSMGVPLV